jgi:hypothetical protein
MEGVTCIDLPNTVTPIVARITSALTRSDGSPHIPNLSFEAIVSAEISPRVQRENRRNPRVNCAEKQKAAEAAFVL